MYYKMTCIIHMHHKECTILSSRPVCLNHYSYITSMTVIKQQAMSNGPRHDDRSITSRSSDCCHNTWYLFLRGYQSLHLRRIRQCLLKCPPPRPISTHRSKRISIYKNTRKISTHVEHIFNVRFTHVLRIC